VTEINEKKAAVEALIQAYEDAAAEAKVNGEARTWVKGTTATTMLTDIDDAITELTTLINTKNTDGEANTTKYNDIKGYIDNVFAAFNAASKAVEDLLVDKADDETYKFKDKFAEAKAELDEYAAKIKGAYDALEVSKTAGTCAADEADIKARLNNDGGDVITDDIAAIQAKWETFVNNEVSTYALVKAFIEQQRQIIANVKGNANYSKYASAQRNRLESQYESDYTNAITTLETYLNQHNADHTVASYYGVGYRRDDNETDAVNRRGSQYQYYLNNTILTSWNNYQTVLNGITALETPYVEKRDIIKEQISDDTEYVVKNYYATYESDVESKIANRRSEVNAIYNAIHYNDIFPETINLSGDGLEGLISDYITYADQTLNVYNTIDAKLENYNTHFNDIETYVKEKNYQIYEHGNAGAYTKASYKEMLAQAREAIAAVQGQLDAALTKKDKAHWEAMITLGNSVDYTAIDAQQTLMPSTATADSDETLYSSASLAAAHGVIYNMVKRNAIALADGIEEFKQTYLSDESVLGSRKNLFEQEYNELKTELGTLSDLAAGSDPETAEPTSGSIKDHNALTNDQDAVDGLNEDLNKLSELTETLTDLNTRAATRAEFVLANKATFNSLLGNATSKWNTVNTLWTTTQTNLSANNNGTTGAKDVFVTNNDFATQKTEVGNKLTELQTAINTAYGDETLNTKANPSDEKTIGEGIADEITELTTTINTLKATALKYQKQYTAYKNMLESNNWAYQKVAGTEDANSLANVKAAAQAKDNIGGNAAALALAGVDGLAWTNYYMGKFNEFQSKLTAIANDANITNNSLNPLVSGGVYDSFTVEQINAFAQRLKTLQENYLKYAQTVTGTEPYASTANESVDKNAKLFISLATKLDAAQTQWNTTNLEILAKDETTQLDEWKAKLSEKQQAITAYAAEILEAYKGGTAYTKTDLLNTFVTLKSDIAAIGTAFDSNYNTAVGLDNEAAKNSFDDKVGAIQDELAAISKTLSNYKGVQTEELQDAVEAIIASMAELNTDLYEYPTKLQDLVTEANETFQAAQDATPHTFWDKDWQNDATSYNSKAQTMLTEIQTLHETFKNAVQEAIEDAAQTTLTGYKTAAYDLRSDLMSKNGYSISSSVAPKLFNLIADVEAAQTALNNGNIFELDNSLVALSNFDEQLLEAANEAYGNLLNGKITTLENEYAEGRETLDEEDAAIYTALYEETVKAARDLYNEAVADAAVKDAWTPIVALLDEFNDSDNNVVKKNQRNAVAYEAINTRFDNLEAYIAEIADYANGYFVGEQVSADLVAILKDVAEKRATLEESTASANQNSFNTFINNRASYARPYSYINLKNLEIAALNAAKAALVADYNTFAAKNPESEKVAEYKALIDEIDTKMAAANSANNTAYSIPINTFAFTTYAYMNRYQEIETYIAEVQKTLSEAIGADLDATAADLNKRIADIKTAAAAEFDALEDKVKADYQEAYDAAVAAFDAVEAGIAAYKEDGTLAFYEPKVNNQIDNAEADVNAVIEKAKADNQKLLDNKAGKAALDGALAEMQKEYDAVKTAIMAYGNVTLARWNRNIEDIETRLARFAQYITDNDGSLAANAAFDADDVEEFNTRLASLAEDVAKADVENYLDVLYNQLSAINSVVRNKKYSEAVRTKLNEKRADINAEAVTFNEGYGLIEADGTVYDNHDALMAQLADLKVLIDEYDEMANKEQLGDINGTGAPDVEDYFALADAILSGNVPAEGDEDFYKYDVNEDGVVNVGDAQAVINLILYGEVRPTAARGYGDFEEASESIDLAVTGEGSTQRIALNLNNSNAYVGMQADIILPEGMTLREVSLTDRAEKQQLRTSDIEGGVRVLAHSFENVVFAGNSGAVLYIDVEVNGNYAGGDIELKNVYFTDAKANTVNFEVGGQTTGIAERISNALHTAGQKVYNLGGRLMDGVKKGINIIRNADGSTSKVVKK